MPEIAAAIGVNPHADLCLSATRGDRRIWIEFEISRADPVANHVKFAVAHGFLPQRPGYAEIAAACDAAIKATPSSTVWIECRPKHS